MIVAADDTTLDSALRDYLSWHLSSGLSPSTAVVRALHIRKFVAWCAREGWQRLVDVSLEVLEAYRAVALASTTRHGVSLAWSTRINRLAALRLWLRWAVRTGRIGADPSEGLVLPRMPRRLPRAVLTSREVEAVLAAADIETAMGLRDRALLEVMYSTGMRRGEIVRLEMADVDSARGVVFIREGKGGKDRVVPVGTRALVWYARYLEQARPRLAARRPGREDEVTAFLGARGERIRPSRLTERLHAYVNSISGKPGSCHVFRHSMATLMHDGGADIRDLQEMLGHAQLSTTEIYTHVSVERLRAVHALTHPAEAGRAWLGHRLGGGIAPLLALPPQGGRFGGPWGAGRGGGVPRR